MDDDFQEEVKFWIYRGCTGGLMDLQDCLRILPILDFEQYGFVFDGSNKRQIMR